MNRSLEQARELIAETRRYGAKAMFKPLTVVVLDAGGHVLAAEREDGSSNMRFQIAGGALIPVPSGVFIRQGGTDGGSIVGAIGGSGDSSDNDEAAALAGIEAVGLIAQVD